MQAKCNGLVPHSHYRQPAHANHNSEFTLSYFHTLMSLQRKVRHVANWPYARPVAGT